MDQNPVEFVNSELNPLGKQSLAGQHFLKWQTLERALFSINDHFALQDRAGYVNWFTPPTVRCIGAIGFVCSKRASLESEVCDCSRPGDQHAKREEARSSGVDRAERNRKLVVRRRTLLTTVGCHPQRHRVRWSHRSVLSPAHRR